MSKTVNTKWKKTFPDTIGNQNRPAEGVDDTQAFETGGFPQYMANDPVRYDLQNAAMSQSMSNDARLKEMVDARGKELDDHKVDPGAHKTGIAGNAATAAKVVANAAVGDSANIAEATMAENDYARIRVSGETNEGELALETADDASEPIVARQYAGVYTNPVRTAKILDESGNTSFPGTVVAPKFTGALNGNAATASKLATPCTLSLTGNAAGSTSFDGSANASINVTNVNADTASKLSTARKINITGDATGAATFDGTGDISINTTVNESKHAAAATTVNATAPNGGAADLAFGTMAVNDYARIRVYGNEDDGALEIATADAGNEPIYVRQYSGNYSWLKGKPGTVARTAAILDSNGNTSFPGKVGAASFTGPLNGNASTATTASMLQITDGNGAIDNGKFYWVGEDGQPMWLWGSNTKPSETYIYNPSNFHVSAADNDGNGANIANTYLKRSVGYMEGPLNFANGTWNLVGDDSYMGDIDISGTLGIKGANGETGIALVAQNGDKNDDFARISYDGGNINFSKTIGGNITGNAGTATNADKLDGYHASDLLGKIYPVGSIYMSMVATNPASLFGIGTWERISQGRMLLGADDSGYKAGATGGEATHTLSVNEMPAHSHGISNSGDHTHNFYGSDGDDGPLTEGDGLDAESNNHYTHNERYTTSSAGAHTHTISNEGGGAAHNNMPPYLVCYIWQRTA